MEVNNSNIGPGLEVNGQEMRYRDAFNNTLRSELEYDKNVLIIGEDISGGFDKKTKEPLDAWGGPFAATKLGESGISAFNIVDDSKEKD